MELHLDRFIFPIFSSTPIADTLSVHRFLGMGFWIHKSGHFATCKHVLEALEPGQVAVIAQPHGPRPDYFFPIQQTMLHPTFDVAVGKASASAVGGVLPFYTGSMPLGLEVQAFGYTDSGKGVASYKVDPRLLRGHISRASNSSYGLPSPSLIEVSFGSPSGFSGTPLLVNAEVIGILYSNLDSKLQAYSIQETIDGDSQFREVAYRIYEYGIAHRISDLSSFFAECGVGN